MVMEESWWGWEEVVGMEVSGEGGKFVVMGVSGDGAK